MHTSLYIHIHFIYVYKYGPIYVCIHTYKCISIYMYVFLISEVVFLKRRLGKFLCDSETFVGSLVENANFYSLQG